MDRAEVTSICFNQQSTFVACCSDRGTVHIFSLEAGVKNNSGAAGAMMGGGGGGGGMAPDESPRMGAATGARRSNGASGTLNAMSGLVGFARKQCLLCKLSWPGVGVSFFFIGTLSFSPSPSSKRLRGIKR